MNAFLNGLGTILKHSLICVAALKARLRASRLGHQDLGFGRAQLAGYQSGQQGVAERGEGLGLLLIRNKPGKQRRRNREECLDCG